MPVSITKASPCISGLTSSPDYPQVVFSREEEDDIQGE
jgi:hypothetical protein